MKDSTMETKSAACNFKQLQLVLNPTPIVELLEMDLDKETLAEALLMNFDETGSIFLEEDESENFEILQEDLSDFHWDEVILYYDTYKSYERCAIILKIKDRYFSCTYDSSPYGVEFYGECEEVLPVAVINHEVDYEPIDKVKTFLSETYSKHYKELFENNKK